MKTFHYAHNRKRKRLKYWILVGRMNTSCNISSRTCRRPTVVQQQDLPAAEHAGGPQSCSSKTYLQQQQQQQQQQQPRHAVAASCRSNKQQKAPTSRSAVYLVRCSAPAGITLIFSLSSSSATQQNNKNEMKISDKALSCSKFSPAKPT